MGKVKDATGKIATRVARLDKIESDIEDNEGKAATVASSTERNQADIAARATESAADRASRMAIAQLEVAAREKVANMPSGVQKQIEAYAASKKVPFHEAVESYMLLVHPETAAGRVDVARTKEAIAGLQNTILTVPVKDRPAIQARIDALIQKLEGGTPARATTPRAAPAVGTVKDGYKFKGGNPADETNWEKV
jgi:hypothetical protein